ncbi:methyltransferase [Sorangium cellulosum]|uniref:Methyltransferase n=1 Tax=Sorangium cellulosum TaxID=56 RepID=A0A4P2QCD9_SORCE|nr:methyltransferase [Sorangium cellulosum]AUX27407.1 methyltransferase [Sorangium cellulosum]
MEDRTPRIEDIHRLLLSPGELAALAEPERSLYLSLPPTLPAEEIERVNRGTRMAGGDYVYRGLEFAVPPGVLVPGGTSEVIFDALHDGLVEARGASVIVMGCGAGVEPVLARQRGAREIRAMDIHEASVASSLASFERHTGPRDPERHHFLVSDLFSALPRGERADVIVFNPPANPLRSDDPDLTRVNFSGSAIMARFFDEIASRALLAPGGRVITVLSNASDLRGIVAHALRRGFRPEVLQRKTWTAPYDKILTHLLSLTLDER